VIKDMPSNVIMMGGEIYACVTMEEISKNSSMIFCSNSQNFKKMRNFVHLEATNL
jgi:hypothetical protein